MLNIKKIRGKSHLGPPSICLLSERQWGQHSSSKEAQLNVEGKLEEGKK